MSRPRFLESTREHPNDRLLRIGEGSIGGKGRGIGFLNVLLNKAQLTRHFPSTRVVVPKAAVICTREFEHFIDHNRLDRCMSWDDDDAITRAFLRIPLGPTLTTRLDALLAEWKHPIAVRSSSVNEDAAVTPLAGLYTTVLLPNRGGSREQRLRQLTAAVRIVWASTFHQSPKNALKNQGTLVSQERMAVVIHSMAGRIHGDFFYPRVAGVAQSLNFFPQGSLSPEDGIVNMVVGLGTRAVGGGHTVRFSPHRPGIRPELHSPGGLWRNSQSTFDAIDLRTVAMRLEGNGEQTLARLGLDVARRANMLDLAESTWDPREQSLSESPLAKGVPLLTFNRLLAHDGFPLPAILEELLDRAREGLGAPADMEFTADFRKIGPRIRGEVALVQLRRQPKSSHAERVKIADVPKARTLLRSLSCLGNADMILHGPILYIPPLALDPGTSRVLAEEVSRINHYLRQQGESCLLLGPGRWGTVNPALGIPVTYHQISEARVIAEYCTPEMRVAASQGSHFFQNIAAGHVLYFGIDPTAGDVLNREWLDSAPVRPVSIDSRIRLIDPPAPLRIQVDGASRRGVVFLQGTVAPGDGRLCPPAIP